MSENNTKPVSVLFVCLGNICRSPSAEAVFKHKAQQRGLALRIDSAGTHGYHIGSPADKRSQATGEARGYSFAGLSCRKVAESDFQEFDYIMAMDKANLANLQAQCPLALQHKLALFLSYSSVDEEEVPDPYYGGQKGFELVLDFIEDAAEALLDHIQCQVK